MDKRLFGGEAIETGQLRAFLQTGGRRIWRRSTFTFHSIAWAACSSRRLDFLGPMGNGRQRQEAPDRERRGRVEAPEPLNQAKNGSNPRSIRRAEQNSEILDGERETKDSAAAEFLSCVFGQLE